jgi:hypothetical protein
LLACNSIEESKLLSLRMNRPLVASDGWIDLYANGTITSEKAFVRLQAGNVVANLGGRVSSSVGAFLSLRGDWLTVQEMRLLTNNWATVYRQGLTSNTQLARFNKACTASWRNAPNGQTTIFYGRNGGILNTNTTFPTISAENGLGIHPELQRRLPENTIWPNVANCAECDAVNQALHAGAKWDEIQIHTIDIRPNGTMSDVIQCSECLNIFSGMRVTSQ